MHFQLYAHNDWVVFILSIVFSTLIALVAHAIVFRLLKRFSDRVDKYHFIQSVYASSRAALIVLVILMGLPASPLGAGGREAVERILDLALIGCVAWILIVLIQAVENALADHYRIDIADNLMARRIRTRLQVFHHVTIALIVLLTAAVALMTFPHVRTLGASLLASAGLAGIVAGMAARPALTNLMAGLQIAFTEPIRLEDVVIVEGEWGWIEEIYATYVVVRIWDLRRMILPLSYFIEHPFQNWTRTSAEILGTVFISVDYRVPVEAVRNELKRILQTTPLWKGQVCGLQVTDTTEQTVQLRALMDATDSGRSFDLRCYVREKLIDYLQREHPESLPQHRVQGSLSRPPAHPSTSGA